MTSRHRSCAHCGDVIYPLRQVTALPGGGKAYGYGVYVQYMPPGFSILKASDSQLAEYGLPTLRGAGRQLVLDGERRPPFCPADTLPGRGACRAGGDRGTWPRRVPLPCPKLLIQLVWLRGLSWPFV